MHKYLITLLILTFLSCKTSTEEKKTTFDTSNLVEHQIDFLNASLWLSPSYEMITYNEMLEMVKTAPNQAFEFLIQTASSYENKVEKPIYFTDELATENIIVIYPKCHINL